MCFQEMEIESTIRSKARNPSGRRGAPKERAKAVVFMASPAGGCITGSNLVVDGALTRGVQF